MDNKSKKSELTAGKCSDNYNGSSTSQYSWSQTIKDLEVKVPVSKDIRKGKDLLVTIKAHSLEVRLSGQSTSEPLVSGQFPYPVDKEESYWNLIPGEAIIIFLQKSKERWWTGLLESEEPIDPSSIEAVVPMEDLGEEEQMKVAELMWKDEQKKKGLAANDANVEAILKKAWNAEGSPFKGTPYDRSSVKFGNDKVPEELLEAVRSSSAPTE